MTELRRVRNRARALFISFMYRSFILPMCTIFEELKTQDRKNIGSKISRRLATILWSFCAHTTVKVKARRPMYDVRARIYIRALTSVLTAAGSYPINSDVNARTTRAQPDGKFLNEHLTGRRYINQAEGSIAPPEQSRALGPRINI